jgi:hypothetical protein
MIPGQFRAHVPRRAMRQVSQQMYTTLQLTSCVGAVREARCYLRLQYGLGHQNEVERTVGRRHVQPAAGTSQEESPT